MSIRRAETADIPAIGAIYEAIHDAEAAGQLTTGWLRDVYPTAATAAAAIAAGDLFVLEENGEILASARINREQVDVYAQVPWQDAASNDQVMVLHTLAVAPAAFRQGCGKRFVAFYEAYAIEQGCPFLRMDTNARNLRARAMYQNLGYREAGIVPCTFNGIPGVELVCLEKRGY